MFKIEELSSRARGVFILEFIGGGLRSRVMIKKGSLSLIRLMKQKGVEFYILDHKNEITKPLVDPHAPQQPKHGIFFESKFYPSDPDGKIAIPYGVSESKGEGILVDNGFSQLHQVQIPAESIKLNFSCLMNFDNLRPGKSIQMALLLKLFVAGEVYSIK